MVSQSTSKKIKRRLAIEWLIILNLCVLSFVIGAASYGINKNNYIREAEDFVAHFNKVRTEYINAIQPKPGQVYKELPAEPWKLNWATQPKDGTKKQSAPAQNRTSGFNPLFDPKTYIMQKLAQGNNTSQATNNKMPFDPVAFLNDKPQPNNTSKATPKDRTPGFKPLPTGKTFKNLDVLKNYNNLDSSFKDDVDSAPGQIGISSVYGIGLELAKSNTSYAPIEYLKKKGYQIIEAADHYHIQPSTRSNGAPWERFTKTSNLLTKTAQPSQIIEADSFFDPDAYIAKAKTRDGEALNDADHTALKRQENYDELKTQYEHYQSGLDTPQFMEYLFWALILTPFAYALLTLGRFTLWSLRTVRKREAQEMSN